MLSGGLVYRMCDRQLHHLIFCIRPLYSRPSTSALMAKKRVRRHILPYAVTAALAAAEPAVTPDVPRANIVFHVLTPRGLLTDDERKDSINYDLQIFDCELDEHLIAGLPRYFQPTKVPVAGHGTETINEVTLRLRHSLTRSEREKMMRELFDLLREHGAKVTMIGMF
jgi:hypothetical protein